MPSFQRIKSMATSAPPPIPELPPRVVTLKHFQLRMNDMLEWLRSQRVDDMRNVRLVLCEDAQQSEFHTLTDCVVVQATVSGRITYVHYRKFRVFPDSAFVAVFQCVGRPKDLARLVIASPTFREMCATAVHKLTRPHRASFWKRK